jgi:hypothetical protein
MHFYSCRLVGAIILETIRREFRQLFVAALVSVHVD